MAPAEGVEVVGEAQARPGLFGRHSRRREMAGGCRVCATSIPRRVSEYSSGGLPSLRVCSRRPVVCWAISPWR